MKTPTTEEFKYGALINHTYKAIHIKLYRSFHYSLGEFKDLDIPEFIKPHEQLRKQALKETLARYKGAIQWLTKQPAFLISYPELIQFINTDSYNRVIEKLCILVKKHYYQKTETYQGNDVLEKINFYPLLIHQTPHTLESLLEFQKLYQSKNMMFSILGFSELYDQIAKINDYSYIEVLAQLSLCGFLYLSGGYKEKAINLKKHLTDLKQSINKIYKSLDHLLAAKYQLDNIKQYALPYIDYETGKRQAIQQIEILEAEQLLMGNRNDASVQERMMILDLIRFNYSLFYKDEKHRIYKTMSLPFIENIVEMNTITRLIRAENKNRVKKLRLLQNQ